MTGWTRINRYIMECKCTLYVWTLWDTVELIDTLWNVNIILKMVNGMMEIGINRYIMECK